MYKNVSIPRSRNLPDSKQKVTLWNTDLFRIGFTPVLRVLLGGQISSLSTKVKNQHIALYLREKGHLLLLISQEKGTPLSYHQSIPLTQVDLDSPNGRSDDNDCNPFLKKQTKYAGRVVELVLRRELKGVLLIFSSNGNSDSEFQNIKTKPYLRTITIFLSLLSLLLRDRQHFSRLQIINRISQKIDFTN